MKSNIDELREKLAVLEAKFSVLQAIVEKQNVLMEMLARVTDANKKEHQEMIIEVVRSVSELNIAVFPKRN